MEFFARRHLAANQEHRWAKSVKEEDEVMCRGKEAVDNNAMRQEWIEVRNHAVRIWTNRRNDDILLASLAELFQPVVQLPTKAPWKHACGAGSRKTVDDSAPVESDRVAKVG